MTIDELASQRPLTDQEEAEIQRMIAADPDAAELTDAELEKGLPFAEALPELAASARIMRGPQKAPTKQVVSFRASRDVLDKFKAGGSGWQARMNDARCKAVGL